MDKDRNALAKTNAYTTTLAMTPAEKTLAKQGVLASLLTKTRNADGSLNTKMLQKYFDPSNYTAQAIKNIFGTDYNRLERFVNTEALFRNTLATISKNAGRSDAGLYDKLRGLRVVPTSLLSKPIALAQYVYGVAEHFGRAARRELRTRVLRILVGLARGRGAGGIGRGSDGAVALTEHRGGAALGAVQRFLGLLHKVGHDWRS